jgi:signal transduction histidine kinase
LRGKNSEQPGNDRAMKRLLAMALVAIVLTTAVSLWAYLSGSRTLHAEARELNTAIAASSVGNELAGSGSHANGSASPRGRAQALVDRAHAWAKKITIATAATGLGLTGVILGAAAFWQRRIGKHGGANSASPTQPAGRGAQTLPSKTVALPTATSGNARISGPPVATAEAVVQQLRFELSTHVKERRRIEAEFTDLKTQFDKRLQERTAAVSAELNQRKQAEKTLSQQRQELERSKDVLELHVQARTQQLQTLQRRYEHILNSAGEGIYGLDMQGKTTFVNPAAAKLTGYTVEELLGKPELQTILRNPKDPLPQTGSTEHTRIGREQIAPNSPIITNDTEHTSGPHLRDAVLGAHNSQPTSGHTRAIATSGTRLVARASAPGASPEGLALSSASARPETLAPSPANIAAHTSGEQTFYRKDGTPVLVEYTRTSIIENNKQMGTVVTFKDITERKRAEETLARKAAELARSNGELEQFAYVASHDLQEPLRKIRAFGDRLKTTIDQLTSQNPESRIQNSESSGASPGGNTQIRRRKTKSADTQITSRNPAPPQPENSGPQPGAPSAVAPTLVGSARDYLERMQNAAARMQTLINDLLTFSRVISTTQPFIPVDLGAITREVLGDLELRIQQTGAKIHLGDLPTIHADPMQMRQLLQNIIANALKFQPTGRAESPEVKITAQLIDQPFGAIASSTGAPNSGRHASALATTQVVELSIQDNGIGFDSKYTDKIFAMFQRLHGRSEYEGTGVGLAVCRRITDRHSGSITATSELGKGATFIIRLPVHQTNKE